MSFDEIDGDDDLRELLAQIVGQDSAGEVLAHMRERGMDPRAMLGNDGKLPDPTVIQAAMEQVRRLMQAGGDSPVNAVIAHDVARQAAVTGGDPTITGTQADEVRKAFRNAELWLDVATDFAPAAGDPKAWSRAEWVEATLPTWNKLVAPVAVAMSEALVKVMGHGVDENDPLSAIQLHDEEVLRSEDEGFGGLGADALNRLGLGGLKPADLLKRLGSTAYGMQIGQAAGTLSREVFGITDLGFPLVTSPNKALLPSNLTDYAKDLEVSADELTTYLAVREAATARLFAAAPWLRAHLESLIEQYARQTEIDLHQLEEQMHGVDPSSSEQLGQAMTGGIFNPAATPEQQATLLRLETALALIEGWVEEVTTAATIAHLPNTMALREMMRRRRGAGGPAEQAFASLVGLELRPRRSRDAAKLISHVYTAGGVEGRDAIFNHPDLLPTAADLDDPAGYLARRISQAEASSDLDAALAEILGQ